MHTKTNRIDSSPGAHARIESPFTFTLQRLQRQASIVARICECPWIHLLIVHIHFKQLENHLELDVGVGVPVRIVNLRGYIVHAFVCSINIGNR